MNKIILLSGGKIKEDYPWLQGIVTKDMTICLLHGMKNDKKWSEIITETFPNNKIIVSTIDSFLKDIEKADVIFVPGGKPDKILEYMQKDLDILREMLKNKIYIGYSAGALIAGEKCIITPDHDYPKVLVLNGLKLLNFSVEVHYDKSQKKFLESIPSKIIALYDGSYIIKGEYLEIIGDYDEFN